MWQSVTAWMTSFRTCAPYSNSLSVFLVSLFAYFCFPLHQGRNPFINVPFSLQIFRLTSTYYLILHVPRDAILLRTSNLTQRVLLSFLHIRLMFFLCVKI
jgi:hypothetical protein